MDERIKQLVELIREEANKETSDAFFFEKMKNSDIYKSLSSDYDNVDEIMSKAYKKTNLYIIMEEEIKHYWKETTTERVWGDDHEKNTDIFLFRLEVENMKEGESFLNPNSNLCKFINKYGRDGIKELIFNTISKFPRPVDMHYDAKAKAEKRSIYN